MRSLKGTFRRLHKDQLEHEQTQEKIIGNLAEHLQHTFDELHREFDERERVLDKKLKQVDQARRHDIERVKWLSVPAGIIATLGLVYLFYVVHVMERSMTSMSTDMHAMSGHITTMAKDTHSMSDHMASMNRNIASMNHQVVALNRNVEGMNYAVQTMNRNIGVMNHSVGTMSQAVAPMAPMTKAAGPMMGMMRSFMPF